MGFFGSFSHEKVNAGQTIILHNIISEATSKDSKKQV
jgi:hypothetical protein